MEDIGTNAGAKWSSATIVAFTLVWAVGTLLSFFTLRLVVSGTLWNLHFPPGLITMTVLVGLWQWIWLGPALHLARIKRHRSAYLGLLQGGISFSVVQLAGVVTLFLTFRHFTFQ